MTLRVKFLWGCRGYGLTRLAPWIGYGAIGRGDCGVVGGMFEAFVLRGLVGKARRDPMAAVRDSMEKRSSYLEVPRLLVRRIAFHRTPAGRGMTPCPVHASRPALAPLARDTGFQYRRVLEQDAKQSVERETEKKVLLS